MARRPSFSPLIWLSTLAWAVALALVPWWIGFPLLLAMVAALCLLEHRLAPEHRWLLRHALNCGLPGVLFALQRALGGNVFAWVIALLGVLTGYTLLAGLEAWLDRDVRRAKAAEAGKSSGAESFVHASSVLQSSEPQSSEPQSSEPQSSEPQSSEPQSSEPQSSVDKSPAWPRLALSPIGPPAEIIELQLPVWSAADRDAGIQTEGLEDPHGGRAIYRDGTYLFDDGTRVENVAALAAFSPHGRWFVARMVDDRGIVLRDREQGRLHRLRGWRLDGWYREQPWLIRRDADMPLALRAVLGEDPSDEERPV
jgi:hypothetical protein